MDDTFSSLQKQLAEVQKNLRLIQERKSDYVLGADVPLQLVKEERHLESQIADLQARLERLRETPCPYRGMEPFEAEHAAFYFGREKMVERLAAKVKESTFVAVVGPSGCGKSSLVRAGLVTALPGWDIRFFRPGADPLRALAVPLVALLEPEADEIDRLAQTRKLADHLREKTFPLGDVAAQLKEKRPVPPRLILVADQFEELYTECPDKALRQSFIEALLAAAENGIAVVLTLRADFYGRVLTDRQLGKAIDTSQVTVLPMGEDELRDAVERPALNTGWTFDAGLVDRILADVAEQPGNLPLLEFALTELWQRQTAEGVLSHAAYDVVGKVAGAITRRAETVYNELEAQGQGELVRRIFLQLVHYGEETEDTRRRMMVDELVTPRTPHEAVEQALKALADARLLVTGQDEAQLATVEVAHEALIRGWTELRRWLEDDRAFGLWRERLAAARRVWEDTKRDEGALLRGVPLSEAEGWLAGRGDDLNEAECAFVQASLTLRERLRHRTITAISAAVLFVILALAGFAWFQQDQAIRQTNLASTAIAAEATSDTRRHEVEVAGTAETNARQEAQLAATAEAIARQDADEKARVALARQVAAEALVGLDLRPQRSLLLAVEAVSMAQELNVEGVRIPAAEESLRQVIAATGGIPLRGHIGIVDTVVFSPDGHWLAMGSGDGTARLWQVGNLMTGPVVLQKHDQGYDYGIRIAFSPDGRWLATGGDDKTVRLWNVGNLKAEPTVLAGHEGAIRAMTFSPDGHWLVTGSDDNTVRLWEASNPMTRTIVLRGHESAVRAVAVSLDGRWLATGSDDKTARLWKMSDPTAEPIVLRGHGMAVQVVAFSKDGRWLATGSEDSTTRLWSMAELGRETILLRGHASSVVALAFSPDGRWLATGSWDTTVRLWNMDIPDLGAAPVILRGHERALTALAFSPDGHWLLTGSEDTTARLWDMTESDLLAKMPIVLRGHEAIVAAVAFSPDGRWIATAGSWDLTARLWDMTSTGFEPVALREKEDSFAALAFSPDGHWLATCGGWGTPTRLWNMTNVKNTAVILPRQADSAESVAFSPDGRWLATRRGDKTVLLWNVSTLLGTNVAEPVILRGHDAVTAIAFSPDGRWLATGGRDATIRLWNITSQIGMSLTNPFTVPVVFRGQGSVTAMAFSSDGHWLATGSGDTDARLWDVSELPGMGTTEPVVLRGHEGAVSAVAFSLDGRWLATGSYDATARLWDVSTQLDAGVTNLITTPVVLRGHERPIQSVAFSPDGHWLATAGGLDKSARLWDMTDPEGDPVVLRVHASSVTAVVFSPDGRLLATSGLDGTVRLWNLRQDILIELACRRTGRNLTREEWTRYFGSEPYRQTCPQWPESK